MNILLLADVSLPTPCSGSEQVLYYQAKGLTKKQLNVFAITRRYGNAIDVEYLSSEGIQIACYRADVNKPLSFFKSLFKSASKAFDQFSSKTSFSVSISHQPFTCFALLAKKRLNLMPLIYIFHSPNHEEYILSKKINNRLRQFVQAWLRKKIEGYCLRKSTRILVLSQFMKQKVIEIHRIGDEKIIVNPGGVDLERFNPPKKRNSLKEELGLPAGRRHLLTVRNLEPRMGLDNLLKAIFLIKEQVNDVHLVIGGEGPERQKLENLIRRYDLVHDVTLTGFIPVEKLPQYYGAADFFVLPTWELEGFGLVTVESLACGTPVLGTPIGGTEEILSNFDSKFLFKDNSYEAIAEGIHCAINNYLKDENRYFQLRDRCRSYAEQNYSWQRHLEHLKSIIDEISCNN